MYNEYNESEKIKNISIDLYYTYNEYYWTVFMDFIKEAVKNTLEDFKRENKKNYTLEDIHNHISHNYI